LGRRWHFRKIWCIERRKIKKQVEDLIIYRTTYQADKNAEKPKVEIDSGDDAWAQVEEENNQPFVTLKEYLERNKERHENSVFYCTNPQTQSTYVDLYKNQGIEVLFMDSFIDTNYFIPFLEREYNEVKFSRVDSELDSSLVEEDKASDIVNPNTNKTRSEEIKEIFETAINKPKVNIKTQSLKAEAQEETPPAMVLLPEAMRRFQEMTAMMQQREMKFPDEHMLVINTSHPLIENIYQLNKGAIIQGRENPTTKKWLT